MTAKEFHERILSLIRRRPFVPFEVELISGERFIVDRPHAVACDGGSAIFGEADDGPIHLFDYTDTKDMGRNPYAQV